MLYLLEDKTLLDGITLILILCTVLTTFNHFEFYIMHYKRGQKTVDESETKLIYILCATRASWGASNEQSCPQVALNCTKAGTFRSRII